VRDGKICNPETIFFDEKVYAHKQVDCHDAIIAPGFIELQINGGFGVDFSYDVNSVVDGINIVAKGLLEHGVTSFCPTLVTSPPETYHKVLPKIKKRDGGKNGSTVLGVHIEGPFISKEKKGAHPSEYICKIENGFKSVIDMYGSLENVTIITLAPEQIGTCAVIEELVKSGVTVSLGHSVGSLCNGEAAVMHGASLITHLFNAMLPFHHRDPGLVGLLTSDKVPVGKTVYFGIISDGVHTHPAALRIAYRTHPEGLILVTDAISAMGLEEGTHHIGQMAIEIRQKRAYVAGTTTLCGSITPMDECVRFFKTATKCSIEYALEAASLHPASCIGISNKKGTLDYGSDADFIFIDDDINILSTWIAGELVYQSENSSTPTTTSVL
jgi:N-acetylglucosamine-6-phosphate deacetylase